MIKSILLLLAEGSAGVVSQQYAFWLAGEAGGHIHGLGVIDIKTFEIPVLGTPDGFMPSVVAPPIQESQSLLSEMTASTRTRLDEFAGECALRGISCSTGIETGIPGEIIARAAVACDIVVMARQGYGRAGEGQRVDPLIPAVIRGSIRPVLVAGKQFRAVHRMLVAYDGSVHAARALEVASELGSRPGVECTLANIGSSQESGKETLVPAESFLCHHGVRPRKQIIVGSNASELICGLVNSTGADLLVMGAPIREMFFGSTTERVLSHCGSTVVLQF
jgi:nucleotide-binding universal stress UspA family protein